jgi:hypothetical protein
MIVVRPIIIGTSPTTPTTIHEPMPRPTAITKGCSDSQTSAYEPACSTSTSHALRPAKSPMLYSTLLVAAANWTLRPEAGASSMPHRYWKGPETS